MSDLRITVPLKALICAAFRAALNDGWRFSRIKSGLWRALLQAGMAGAAVWRLEAAHLTLSPGVAVLVALGEGWLVALLTELLRGRERLFTGPLVTLACLSPAPSRALLLAQVVGALSGRLWTQLLIAGGLFLALDRAGLPPGRAALLLAALVAASLAAGGLGHLTAVGALVGLARRWPGVLVLIPALALVLVLVLVWSVLYLFTVGLGQVAAGRGAAVPPDAGAAWGELALIALLSLPGLAVVVGEPGAAPRRGRPTGRDAFRAAWLAVREALDRRSRPLRSRWPALTGGPAGALQAQAWLGAMRNWFSLVRLGICAAVAAAAFVCAPGLGDAPPARAGALYIGIGVIAALFNYGEQAAALFSSDGERAALPVLAGVSPGQLLLGKWLATLPVVPVAALTTFTWAAAGGRGPAVAAGLAAVSGALALVGVTWLVGAAAFDAAPRAGGLRADTEQLAAAFEQVPTRAGGVVGLLGLLLIAAAGIWLCRTDPRGIAALALPTVGAVLAGWRWVDRLWRRGVLG